MARLTHPDLGTIIECDGAVEDLYRAMGWTESSGATASADPATTPRKRTRAKKPVVPAVTEA